MNPEKKKKKKIGGVYLGFLSVRGKEKKLI